MTSPSRSSPLHRAAEEGACLVELMPAAVARLRRLDTWRWGRFRREANLPDPGPIHSSATADRWLDSLENLAAQGPDGLWLASILLAGASTSAGSADLNDDELRLSTHHLRVVVPRWRAHRDYVEGELLAGLTEALQVGRRSGAHRPALVEGVLQAVVHAWSIYRTYLSIRETGLLLAGTPEAESYEGLKVGPKTPAREHHVFLWLSVADLVSTGVQQRLLSLGLDRMHRLVRGRSWGELIEVMLLGHLFGEGRSVSLVRGVLSALHGPEFSARFLRACEALVADLEPDFRSVCAPEQLPLLAHAQTFDELVGGLTGGRVAFTEELELAVRGELEAHARLAERWLDRRLGAPTAAPPLPGDPWVNLRQGLQTFVSALEGEGLRRDELESRHLGLMRTIDGAMPAARGLVEYPFWPGDGEEFRVRRQRAAAELDRYFHLLALAERTALAAELWLRELPAEPAYRAPVARFHELIEHHESCMLIEAWVSQFGPRLFTVFGARPWSVEMACNRELRDLDLRVREMVSAARSAGGEVHAWGWLQTGITARLRELLRRHGVGSALDLQVWGALQRRDPVEASRILRAAGLPGAEAADQDLPVTVAVHVFNAHPPTVRQNLLRNKLIDWRLDRRFLVLGTSSANRRIVEEERGMCIESGATHWFLCARRHKKAGNQNRIIPNAPCDAEGKGYYFTLDDDYLTGSQVLQRIVPLAERHPRVPMVQLPMYLYGSEILGISRARYADAAGMSVWGSITSPGMRDVRLLSRDFAHRRPLALPFGTGTLLKLHPRITHLSDTNGFHTGTVTEDFAQGQVAFGMSYLSHPKAPENQWDDGLLLDEVWCTGDGVELFGRIAQQTRWCEGSIRNALTLWSPLLGAFFRNELGLRDQAGARRPGFLQLAGGTLLAFGYMLEFFSMLLFLVGFPLTVFQAEPSDRLEHSLLFWGGLWAIHMVFHGSLAVASGMSLMTFLDQHFIRFASLGGIADGIYKAIRDPSKTWSANKDPNARLPFSTHLMFLTVGFINLLAAGVGYARGLDIYLLCLFGAATGFWQYRFLHSVPVEILPRIANLPAKNPRAYLAQALLRWEGARRPIDDRPTASLPLALPLLALVAGLTTAALGIRYWGMFPDMGGLLHRQPLFLLWLVASDACQVLALGWLWLFAAAGIRSRPNFGYEALIQAGAQGLVQAPANAGGLVPGRIRALVGTFLAWFLGRRSLSPAAGFVGASGLGILLGGLAFSLRWIHLDRNGAFMDESFYIITGRKFLSEGLTPELAEVMFGSYLYPLVTALAHLAGGVEGSRLVSMVAGAVTVVAVAQVAERLGGRTVGLLGGLLAAVTSQHIYISCLGLYDAPAVAGLAVGLAFVVTALRGRGNEQLEGATRNALLLLGGIAAVFAVLMKYVAVVFLPVMFLAVLVWSWESSRRVFWARLMAFGLPVAGGMLIYVLRHWQILLGWWRFTRTYTTLVESNVDRLIEIYFTESLNLVVGVLLAALGLASFRVLPSAPARRDLLLLGAGVLSFATFHFGTRADVNFAKHVTFTLPFLLPLCALGLRRLLQFVESGFADRGLPRPVALRFSRAVGVLGVVLVGLYQVDKVGGSLQWWPDVRGHTDVARRLVVEGDRALVDDTGAELYLIERGARVDTPFWAAQGASTGVAAARKAVWERAYRTVVLTGGVTQEGKALHEAVGPILATAGYVQVLGFGGAPSSGVWVLPETRPPARFRRPEGL